MGSDVEELDAVVVGAGFGGCRTMWKLRDELGLKVQIFESGGKLGGIWFWNCYPGARVDSDVPIYQYSEPEIWKDWTWTERFPSWTEVRKYFEHVDKVKQVSKNTRFGTKITSADWDSDAQKWTVKGEGPNGSVTIRCSYFIPCIGFATKRHIPDFKGLDTTKVEWYHSSFWPQHGLDLTGKRVAVIGTGASGVQCVQEMGPIVSSLTVYQRTPNFCLPMQQKKLTAEEQNALKGQYPAIYEYRKKTFSGFAFDFAWGRKTLEENPQQREAFYEGLWQNGGFQPWLGTYEDTLFNQEANDHAYNFWFEKVRARLKDPKIANVLAPKKAPHPFGTKRPSLEQSYYEVFNQDNVDIVNLPEDPVVEITETGIRTHHTNKDFDVIVMATGFDSVTGGLMMIDVCGIDKSTSLRGKWKHGTFTYLGLTTHGYPNFFFLYGPQAPTAFCNGPTCAEVQGDWIFETIKTMREKGIKSINPKKEPEDAWRKTVNELNDKSLFPGANSWYMGANIPGKPREALNYAGGVLKYREAIDNEASGGFSNFEQVKA